MENYYIASGKGNSRHKLVAFDNALIKAGISNYNLVRVSSILPANSERRAKIDRSFGSPLYTAYATVSSNKRGEKIATAIAVGKPKHNTDIGVIMETTGRTAEETLRVSRDLVTEAMNNHGIEIDHIEASSIEGIVDKDYLCLVSAICIW